MKNTNNLRVILEQGKAGKDIFLQVGGTLRYVVTVRDNYLWLRLNGATTIGELRRTKPASSRGAQAYYKRTKRLVKVLDDFIQYELAS